MSYYAGAANVPGSREKRPYRREDVDHRYVLARRRIACTIGPPQKRRSLNSCLGTKLPLDLNTHVRAGRQESPRKERSHPVTRSRLLQVEDRNTHSEKQPRLFSPYPVDGCSSNTVQRYSRPPVFD
jgi:hypothetical protein